MQAKASAVKYDRGSDMPYFFGRRQFISVRIEGKEYGCGTTDGLIVKPGHKLDLFSRNSVDYGKRVTVEFID